MWYPTQELYPQNQGLLQWSTATRPARGWWLVGIIKGKATYVLPQGAYSLHGDKVLQFPVLNGHWHVFLKSPGYLVMNYFIFFKGILWWQAVPLVSTHMSAARRRLWLTLSEIREGAWVLSRVRGPVSLSFSSVSSSVKWGSSEYLFHGIILKIKWEDLWKIFSAVTKIIIIIISSKLCPTLQ